MYKNGVFSGPYFHVFGLDTEIYGIDFRYQSKYGKIVDQKKLRIRTFSCNVEKDGILNLIKFCFGRYIRLSGLSFGRYISLSSLSFGRYIRLSSLSLLSATDL